MDKPVPKYGSRPLFAPLKLIAVGDIHGMASELEALLQKILPIEPGTHLVFCGDLIDRGPESPRVLDLITEVYEKYPGQVFVIRGNHDWMLQSYCVHGQSQWFNFIGPTMEQMKQEWGLPDTKPDTIKQVLIDQGIWEWYFDKALPYYESEEVICTHAPFDYTQLLMYGANDYEEDFQEEGHEPHFRHLLDRNMDLMWQFASEEEKRVDDLVRKFKICGHQFKHHKRPRIFRGRAYIDTGCGCVAGRPLSALVYPGKKVIQSR